MLPSLPMQDLGSAEQSDVEEHREGMRLETPRASSVRLLFQDERATPAVLTFLRETKAGRVVSQLTIAAVVIELQ